MRLNILIGGKAGQGINKISEIVSQILISQGYFTFNYRDYPSLIRGGHNFNVLSFSDKRVGSTESKLDIIIAMDSKTIPLHEQELKPDAVKISHEQFEKENLGINVNVALTGALIKILGIDKQILLAEIKKQLPYPESIKAAEIGYDCPELEQKYELKKLNNTISITSGSKAVAQGAINSNINLYIAYPMTPATGVLHELAGHAASISTSKKSASEARQSQGGRVGVEIANKNSNLKFFQAETEIAASNAALGASFAGAITMTGTSGGGFDLMSEALSLQGISEIPLTVYLASRPGPGTGVPTYTSQADLDIALRAGHGEFPRIVIAPGDPTEAIEKTNEAIYLAEKFQTLSIILSDKHLAESEFSTDRKPNKTLPIKITRPLPQKNGIVKASSYEHDEQGNTTESAELTKVNADARVIKYEKIKEETNKFQMIKIFGNKKSKNLVIGWGSTKCAILDAIQGLDVCFLQVLYLKPISNDIKKFIDSAKKTILIENNITGQLGRLLREKTGLKIPSENRILKYDGRPFYSDELKKEIEERLK